MKALSKFIAVSVIIGLAVVMALLLTPQAAHAATCTSNGNGNWTTITWSGCTTPGTDDDVVIAHNVTLNANVEVRGLKINSGATFSGSSYTLTLGYFENNGGTFNRDTSTIAFVAKTGVTPGVYGTSSTIDFHKVTISTGVDFGNGKGVIHNMLTINSGGSVPTGKAPTYASGSTLRYATGSSYTANEEWYPNTTSGPGVPHHVEIASGTTLTFGSATTARTMKGNLTINGALTLSSASGGDLNVGGNWTNNGTFNANGRQVKFNGSGTQTVTGATTFAYLDIANTSGGNVTLASNITVNRELKISSDGTLNAGSTTITMQGDSSAAPPFINNGTFNAGTGTVAFRGINNKNSRVVGSSATTFNNVTMTLGTGATDNRFGVDFYDHDNSKRAIIAGILTLNQYTFVATEEVGGNGTACGSGTCDGTPIYASTSTLRYNNSGTFNSAAEWWPDDGTPDCGSEKGLPYNVVIANDTTVNINAGFANNSKTPNYGAGSNKTVCGSVTMEVPSAAEDNALGSTAGTLTVKGDWINNNNEIPQEGGFTHNNGTVVFNGTAAQTIGGTAFTRFYNLTLNNSSGVSLDVGADAPRVLVDNLLKLSGNTRLFLGSTDLILSGAPSQPAIDPDGGSFSTDKMIVTNGAGALCKSYYVSSPTYPISGAYDFPIGDTTGTADYSPATLNYTAIYLLGVDPMACVRVVDEAVPGGDTTNYPTYITRYWSVDTGGIYNSTCVTTFYYVTDDVVIGSGQSAAALYHWSYDTRGNPPVSSWALRNPADTINKKLSSTVTESSTLLMAGRPLALRGTARELQAPAGYRPQAGGDYHYYHTARSGSPLAVTLASFTAAAATDGVTLAWETVAETDNAGFNLYRATSPLRSDDFSRPSPAWHKLNDALIPSAAPGSAQGHAYTWTDTTVEPGATYWYWLEDVSLAGGTTLHGPVSVTVGEPTAVGLVGLSAAGGPVSALPGWAVVAALGLALLAGLGAGRRRTR